MYVTGEPDGPPQKAGLPICDYTSGVWGALGVLLALVDRLRRGADGQVIDNAIYESILPAMKDDPAVFALRGKVAERVGNRSANVAPGEAYRTRDGHWLFIAPTGDSAFQRAMRAIGRPEWADDPRFATTNDRFAHREPLDSAMESWVASHDRDEVMWVMEKATVPCARRAVHRRSAERPPRPIPRRLRNHPGRHDRGRDGAQRFPPPLRQPGHHTPQRAANRRHTTEFLAGEIGIEAGELEDLRQAGAIQ